MKQTIVRQGHFEACHRLVNHKGNCANLHGHSYKYELEISYDISEIKEKGYLLDFGDIKEHYEGAIDKFFDHSAIFNFADVNLIAAAKETNKPEKLLILSGEPTVERISLIILELLRQISIIKKLPMVTAITLWETAKCRCRSEVKASDKRISYLPNAISTELVMMEKIEGDKEQK